MFIKLTNAAEKYIDQPLIIKKDVIISVYSGNFEIPGDEGAELLVFKTVVYSPTCSWEVKETVDQVFELLSK
jgi:hypothetical protein